MTQKRLRIRSEAREEINSAYEWLFQRNPEAAAAFLTEVQTSLAQIVSHPRIHPLYSKNTRRCILAGFPYSVIFREKEDTILVVAVAHAKRRVGYWTKRL